jgi:hypothetical protein
VLLNYLESLHVVQIPALQQAARLKEKEEARLLAKKKEIEDKKKVIYLIFISIKLTKSC